MESLVLRGCGTALVTPFLPDGSVDYEAYASLVDRQVAAGVHFLVPLGTTGETPTLSDGEKTAVFQLVKEHAKGLPLMPGVGTNSLSGTLANIRLMEPLGPAALLVVVPYYNKPTQQGLYEYYKAVASETDLPVIIYNVPGRTGANILPDTVLRLAADVPNIRGIKEASGNFSQVSDLVRRIPEGFAVLGGDDDMTLAYMAAGAHGVISVASNVAPAEVTQMVEALQRDDLAAARRLHQRLFPLFKACFAESNPGPAKAALAQLGLCGNVLRLPLVPVTESTEALMQKVLSELWK
ncbi:MAG: 4-hydroxy-tetrahydrodipicolinate synthase [Bacteroidales bacterium]|jgi:4-hydroxy-tetrahydrodipicolinate synthase|nr:4-hydroxy-tetrahydrodipicolinate synthase [Bacteroidales bacterium]MBR1577243.1 4-hydroxy-tetrahydrodipicolinate synthase [Bacteroidales bacterium]